MLSRSLWRLCEGVEALVLAFSPHYVVRLSTLACPWAQAPRSRYALVQCSSYVFWAFRRSYSGAIKWTSGVQDGDKKG